MCKNLSRHNRFGFTLIELMTALVITTILAAAAIPTYKAYVNKASLAEATTVISVMERNQIKYFTENGSFISAAPNPAQVPGIATEQDNAFGTSTQWAELGFPVTPGTQVLFSYQAFAGQTEKDSTTPVENDNLFNPNDDMDLQRTGRYTSSIQPAQMKYYALHADDFQFDFGNFGWNACAKGEDPYQACIDACRGNARCEAECEELEEDSGDQMSNCQAGCVEVYGDRNSDGCARRCEASDDGTCGGYAWDYDCYSGATSGDKCISACRGDLSCVKRCDSGAEASTCVTVVGGALSGCAYTGGGGGGGGGGEEPPAEEEEEEGGEVAQDNEEEEEEGEDGVGGGGDAGGMEMGDNEDEDGETTIAENTCADFGVSRPIHFGIQEGVQDYNWVVNTGVTSRSKDPECWLVVRVTQVINGDITTSAPIQINEGK